MEQIKMATAACVPYMSNKSQREYFDRLQDVILTPEERKAKYDNAWDRLRRIFKRAV